MTPSSELALIGLRDFTTLKWYVIPLMAIVFYIYNTEIKKARENGNWCAVFSGLTLFGMDFFNETVNGWIFHLTRRSALWTAPGDTALRTMVGWNIEIMFMFAIGGIIFYNSLAPTLDVKIGRIPERWFWAVVYAVVCVVVEVCLNIGGHLVWEYPFWNRSFSGIWLIFLFGYFHFFVAVIVMLRLKTMKARLIMIGGIYGLAIAANVLALGILGWTY